MIVKSSDNPEIGKIHTDWSLNWNDGREIIGQPCYVVREATLEEYLEECKINNWPIGYILASDKFYEISVD